MLPHTSNSCSRTRHERQDYFVKMTGKLVFLSGHLPEPVRSQTHLKELTDMLEDDRLREALLESLRLDSSCPDIMKAKVHVALCGNVICVHE